MLNTGDYHTLDPLETAISGEHETLVLLNPKAKPIIHCTFVAAVFYAHGKSIGPHTIIMPVRTGRASVAIFNISPPYHGLTPIISHLRSHDPDGSMRPEG